MSDDKPDQLSDTTEETEASPSAISGEIVNPATVPTIPAEEPLEFDIDKAKTNIRNGLISLNTSLFEQVIKESVRLPKIRGVIDKIETKLIDETDLSALNPDQILRLYDIARKSMESSTRFMESMYRMSVDVLVVMEVYKEINAQTNADSTKKESNKVVAIGAGADRRKIHNAKQQLLDKLRKSK